jgi:tRNA dimethylallyltransferase
VASGDRASVLVLVGATATGKTAVGVEVARRVDGEIISADSRAFFLGLDVVTAKPTAAERGGIPHHLINRVPLDGGYDAMAFRRDVERLVPEIASRGRVPLLVGGGTLYLGAVLRGIFEGAPKDEEFRDAIAGEPSEALHERLREVDPDAARRIHPNDRLRIVRALEVHGATGRPISRWQAEARPLPYDFVVFGLRRERSDHRDAIAARVRRMLAAGLVDEVKRLRTAGLSEAAQAYRTIGIPEVVAHLEGRSTKAEMEEAIVRQTWSLARRQSAWFRRDRGIVWLDATGRTAEDLAAGVVSRWEERIG